MDRPGPRCPFSIATVLHLCNTFFSLQYKLDGCCRVGFSTTPVLRLDSTHGHIPTCLTQKFLTEFTLALSNPNVIYRNLIFTTIISPNGQNYPDVDRSRSSRTMKILLECCVLILSLDLSTLYIGTPLIASTG